MGTLLTGLIHNESVVTLDLSDNFIGDAGLFHVKRLIRQNHVLREIYLRNNYITQKGANDMLEFLGSESDLALEKLDLRGNEDIMVKKDVKLRHCKVLLGGEPPCHCQVM